MIVLDVCSILSVLMTYTYFVGLEEVPQHMLGDQRTTFLKVSFSLPMCWFW